jgi:hypothetical protein
MKTNDNTETAAAAPEAPQDEYEYFDHPATEPKLPPDEEAEYFRRIREFRERRKEAGLKIDPETAEVMSIKGQMFDPYEIDPLLPLELGCIVTNTFARAPGSDIWVWDQDLPDATVDVLNRKHRPCVSRTLTSEELIKMENDEPF